MAWSSRGAFGSALAGIDHNDVFKGDFAKGREAYQLGFDQASNVNGETGSLFWTTTSYVYEGNLPEALKSIERQRAFAEKEGLVPTVIGTHEQAAFILAACWSWSRATTKRPWPTSRRRIPRARTISSTPPSPKRNGNAVGAARLYSKVAAWNQNTLGHAIVRARARARKS